MLLRSSSYPCGQGTPVEGWICWKAQLPAALDPDCVPQNVCDLNNAAAFRIECCDCEQVFADSTVDFCQALLPSGCWVHRTWSSQQGPIVGLPWYFPPDNTGQLLTYVAPSCIGDFGAPLINHNANSIFAIMIDGTNRCDRSVVIDGQPTNNLGLAYYAQLVDRGQAEGIWVGALVSALNGQAPIGPGFQG
jgi:hypothetical protein